MATINVLLFDLHLIPDLFFSVQADNTVYSPSYASFHNIFIRWYVYLPCLIVSQFVLHSYELSDSLESESDVSLPMNDMTLSTNGVTLSINGGSKQTGTIKKRLCSFLHPPKSPVGDRFLQVRILFVCINIYI